jgi:hypothetical protein
MKVIVEVDCTPEEGRRFLGLPDVVPMQQAAMEKLQQRMESAVEASTPEALLKAWLPMAPDQMQQAFAKLFGAFGGAKPATGADTATANLSSTASSSSVIMSPASKSCCD